MQPLILHLTQTPCAGAVGMLSDCIDKYSFYDSKVFARRTSVSAGNFDIDYTNAISLNCLCDYIQQADLIHLHNSTPEEWNLPKTKKYIIQLHSEPKIKGGILQRHRQFCVTIAQKHALLYKDVAMVPNIIPIYRSDYVPKNSKDNITRIVYAPTSKIELQNYDDTCRGKGYNSTMQILSRLRRKYKSAIEVKIFYQSDKKDVLLAKQLGDIVIDECVTGGYHLCSLEGLATGNIVFGYLYPEVINILCRITGCKPTELPWINTHISRLEEELDQVIQLKLNNSNKFESLRNRGTSWINKYYRPEDLIKIHENVYNKRLSTCDDPWRRLGVSKDIRKLNEIRATAFTYYNNNERKKEIQIRSLKNAAKGRSAVIMGAGPSLGKINILNFIAKKNPLKFNCNYYFKWFDDAYKPDYWFNIDGSCLNECLKYVPIDVPIICNPFTPALAIKHRRCWISKNKSILDKYFNFPFELERPCTVATIMTLYAMYMGANPIYIIGVDLSQQKSKKNYVYSNGNKIDEYNNKFRDFSFNINHIIREFKLMKCESEILGIDIFNLDPTPTNFKVFKGLKW